MLTYKIFYKKTASGDRRSLCQLRNFIGRNDVHGSEKVQKYRSYYSFIDDCLDAYIVTACLDLFDLSDIDEISSRKQTLFDILPKEEQHNFISQISKEIWEK